MTEEIMPKEDRIEKILTFVSGCISGILGVFVVAVMSELSTGLDSEDGNNPLAVICNKDSDVE